MKTLQLFALLGWSALSAPCYSEVITDGYFQDNMLLQQDRPVVIWGTGEPGEKVDLSLCGERKHAVVDDAGEWELVLSARIAGGEACTLSVNNQEINNIVFGDLWIASGQSNMLRPLLLSDTYGDFADVDDPQLRLLRHDLQVPLKGAYTGEQYALSNVQNLFKAEWQPSEGIGKGKFSAVAWYFGRMLREELDIPIGVIQLAVGGSSMVEWIRLDTMQQNPRLAEMIENWPDDPMVGERRRKRFEANFQEIIDGGTYRKYVGPTRHHMEPSVLFDAGIRPLQKVNFKGFIWYQGEANAPRPEDFNILLPMLVSDWRFFFNQGELPFYYVQLPSYKNEIWPEVREVQRKLATVIPNSDMVVTIDLGLENDIHPTDKKPVGERLARLALSETYGRGIPWQSPVPVAYAFSGEDLLLSYDHYGEGLRSDSIDISGFEAENCVGVISPLKAEIVAEGQIRLIAVPGSLRSVRYAYKPFAKAVVNLWNSHGLPAAPFVFNFRCK